MRSKSSYSMAMILAAGFFLLFPQPVFGLDFYEFNDYLGLCPVSKTLTLVSDGGSYVATVQDPIKFGKICPQTEEGKRVLMYKLDPDHWLVRIDGGEVQFRFEDCGYAPAKGDKFQLTKICDDCPGRQGRGGRWGGSGGSSGGPGGAGGADGTGGPGGMSRDGSGAGGEPENYVIFDFDKDIVKPPYFYIIDNIIRDLKADPEAQVVLQGHTCSIGSQTYNLNLSRKRAQAVRQYMIRNGIAARRIITMGFGYDKPFAGNGTADGRSQNRRVEFIVR
ncbi:MAG: OmpA family protein [Thermodesulfobacteriota bacterium]